jgi:hypothetical protein
MARNSAPLTSYITPPLVIPLAAAAIVAARMVCLWTSAT